MTSANTILNVARKYIGDKEGGTGHKHILAVYNACKPLARGYKVKTTDNWCATFISFLEIEAGNPNLYGRECSVQNLISIFKSKGIWIEDGRITPRVGDIITYNWDDKTQPNDGWADHIGIVEKVSGNKITVIEGNKSNAVGRRIVSVGAGQIRGYGRPKYSGSTTKTTTKAPAKKSTGITWHAENGTFKTDRVINLRESASDSGKLIAKLKSGTTIKYNAYAYVGGYVWIRQKRGKGYGYLATGTEKNGKRVSEKWGTFK